MSVDSTYLQEKGFVLRYLTSPTSYTKHGLSIEIEYVMGNQFVVRQMIPDQMLHGSICIFKKHRSLREIYDNHPLFDICVNIEFAYREKASEEDGVETVNFFYRFHESESGLEAGMRSIYGQYVDTFTKNSHESIATLLSERSRLNSEATVNELKRMVESLRGEVALARRESSEVRQMMRSASIVFNDSWNENP